MARKLRPVILKPPWYVKPPPRGELAWVPSVRAVKHVPAH